MFILLKHIPINSKTRKTDNFAVVSLFFSRAVYMDTNKHDIIVTEAFRAALFRVRLQQVKEEVKARAYIRKSP